MILTLLALSLQQPAPPLQPAGAWELNGENLDCTLLRSYGDGSDSVIVSVRFDPIVEQPRFTLIANARPAKVAERGDLNVSIDNATVFPTPYYAGDVPRQRWALKTHAVAGLSYDKLSATSMVAFETTGYRLAIAPRGIKESIKALRKCDDDLLRLFGVDPGFRATMATPPKPLDFNNWISNEDYPSEAIHKNKGGTTVIRWMVDAAGASDRFEVARSSGERSLDAAAIDALRRRARMKPAIGKDGRPMAVPMVRIVKWTIPR